MQSKLISPFLFQYRLVAKTSLKLLLVFVEYTEANSKLLSEAVKTVDQAQGLKEWNQIVGILEEKGGMGDEELLVYSMTLINKVRNDTVAQLNIACIAELFTNRLIAGSAAGIQRKGAPLPD